MKQETEICILMQKKKATWNVIHSGTKHTMPYCWDGWGLSKRRPHKTITTILSLCLCKDIYLFLKNVGVVRTDWLPLLDGKQHQLELGSPSRFLEETASSTNCSKILQKLTFLGDYI